MIKNRYELKFILNRSQADFLECYVEKIGLKKDEAKGGFYTVTSLYFDTPALEDYYDKQGGFEKRKKLRARIYENDFNNGTSPIWLEIKNKYGMSVNKKRYAFSQDKWVAFIKERNFLALKKKFSQENNNSFLYLFLRGVYKPHIVVRYKRKAYVGEFPFEFRLTFDSGLETCKWRDFCYDAKMVPVKKGMIIMEVKFNEAMPWWFKDMTHRFNFNLSQQTFSKYTNSVDTLTSYNSIPK